MIQVEGSRVTRFMAWAALFFIVIWGIQLTAYIFTILVISLILTLLAWPAMEWLRRRGSPDLLSVTLLSLVAVACVLVLILLSLYSLDVLLRDLPLYQAELNERLAGLSGTLGRYGLSTDIASSPPDLSSLARTLVSSAMSLADLLLYLFFIAVTTFFMLLEAPRISARLGRMALLDGEHLARFGRLSRSMMDFVVVRTGTNLVHGILFGGALAIMGVHAALLWGLLTFALAFIPYIGLIIAALPAIFFAWLQFGWPGALAVIAVVCILNLVVENPVFSYFAARTFEIPALVVIVSVIFWGWLLGIAGMVFSVPLTLMVLILIQTSDELAWVNTLLGVDRFFGEGGEEAEGPVPG